MEKGNEKEKAMKDIRGGVDKGHSCRGLVVSRIESRDGGSKTSEGEEDVTEDAIYDRDQVGTRDHHPYLHPYDS